MRRSLLVAGVMTAALAACAGSDDGLADPDSAPPTAGSSTTEPLFTPASDGESSGDTPASASPAGSPEVSDAAATSTTTIAVVPDTGVPGIDSDDVFCRSWSEFAGTFQALTLAWAFGDATDAARLEVAASDVITTAVGRLAESLPAELEDEREALTVELVGPLSRRAERAAAELAAAGLDAEAAVALGAAWLTALADVGTDDPEIPLALPGTVNDEAFAVASSAFAAEVPAINEDPSLITAVQIPLTEAYLAANCPDQGTLLGNDVIDG